MIDVNIKNFETEVIAASMDIPVLVDFWSPRSGQCKTLSPILETLEADYGGRFKLVKINSDEEAQLAGAFGIKSIPTCILLMNGQPVDGFTGAIPEDKLRAFLDKHVPSEDELMAEAEAAEAGALVESGDPQAALAKLADALATNPANDDVRYDYTKLLIGLGGFEEAHAALTPVLAQIPKQLRFEALAQWMAALEFVHQDDRGNWPLEQFDAAIAANKRDFDTRYAKARCLFAEGQLPAALDELLEIIMRDKKWNDEAARKTFVAILELMTPPKPKASPESHGKTAGGIELAGKAAMTEDPQSALVSSYRRKLSMMLN